MNKTVHYRKQTKAVFIIIAIIILRLRVSGITSDTNGTSLVGHKLKTSRYKNTKQDLLSKKVMKIVSQKSTATSIENKLLPGIKS